MAKRDSADNDVAAAGPAKAGASTAAESATPSMAQYLEIKAANPDSLLWYRMGDFYELFFEDAVVASQALSIVLTKRGRHQGREIPMCGVPVIRADEYLQRLIKQGYKVAVCEQLEDPAEARKRGAKAVVRRDVVRLVTPGTITEEALLDARARNYLTALFRATPAEINLFDPASRIAIASVEISTGEVEVCDVAGSDLAGELVRLSPGEVLASDSVLADATLMQWLKVAGAAATPIPSAYFDHISGAANLKERLGVTDLAGFGAFTRNELAAIGAALKYIDLTQIGQKPVLRPPKRSGDGATVTIDAATRTSLELVKSLSGDTSTSLFAAIDRTVTGAGARELQARLSAPLADVATITARLDAVSYLTARTELINRLRETLKGGPDIARALPRIAFNRAGPRDLAAVRDALITAAEAKALIDAAVKTATLAFALPDQLRDICDGLTPNVAGLQATLVNALADELPLLIRDGNFIRDGYSKDLDDARALKSDSRRIMAELEARYIAETGVKGLKIRHNNILGYFVEVTQLNAKPLQLAPLDAIFTHRQTMANAVRFSTAELLSIEGKIATATDQADQLESKIFADLARQILDRRAELGRLAATLAELDCVNGLASVAVEQAFARPIVDTSLAFDIRGGRHPVVQQAMSRARSGAFIDNDCTLGRAESQAPPGFEEATDARMWLVTGPNMAGKSTFLRQNALIAILAQIGSFVPAKSAHFGILDRIFSRVGAADDLARGRSTFMVEMVETAAILNQATERSLVILDEIGRGTSTFDGLSIAWATVEYLHDVTKCRTLFATHYHELTALARKLSGVANVTMDVTDWQDEIVFLHKVRSGSADRSYGIQVAKLAGLPTPVIARARDVLSRLEKTDRKARDTSTLMDDLPLFAERPATPPGASSAAANAQLLKIMADLKPDELTPRAALEKLYELKTLGEALLPAPQHASASGRSTKKPAKP